MVQSSESGLGCTLSAEVEAVMRGEAWPPALDSEPWLRRKWTKLDAATGKMVRDGAVRVASG